jgi:hypothetical protein
MVEIRKLGGALGAEVHSVPQALTDIGNDSVASCFVGKLINCFTDSN